MPRPPDKVTYCDNRKQAYCALRFKRGYTAALAWERSKDFDAVPRWFGDHESGVRVKGPNPIRGGQPFKAGGTTLTWCEDTSYFRNVQPAHEIINLRHTGWYNDNDFQDEVIRGMVFQIPGRNGKPQYLTGHDDPVNPGTACIDMRNIFNDREEAARDADDIARLVAERECEYREAWNAGAQAAEKKAESVRIVQSLREIVRELRSVTVSGLPAALCGLVKEKLDKGMAEVRRLRADAAKAIDDWGHNKAFRNGLADNS